LAAKYLAPQFIAGLCLVQIDKMRILITAGGTREYIDPVRFISNASTGKMGYALAREALKAGHKVILVTTVARNSFLVARLSSLVARGTGHERRVTVIEVETASEMFDAVKKYFPRCDCLIMAAAVADYTPAWPAKTKIKRENKPLTIKLKPTPDIAKWAGKHKNSKFEIQNAKLRPRVVVGFALEDKNLRANAQKKLKEKNLDMIIANTTTAIGADKITIQIKTPERKWLKLAKASKTVIARKIISLMEGDKKNENHN
jgi:phosphopantothenoylcysteine decarboxylase/phosphopantothenate--cysteine ligase